MDKSVSSQRKQYEAIFEATSDGLIVNDFETADILEVNPAFCRIHGYDRSELIGKNPTMFIAPESQPLLGRYMDAVRDGQTFRQRAIDIRKDGTRIQVDVAGRTFVYDGRPAVLGIVRDITEQVEGERVLEERVAERTKELEEMTTERFREGQRLAALEERQRLARELHDSVSQALYGIAIGSRTALDRALAGESQRIEEPLRYVLELAEGGLAEMRALIFELRPDSLEKEGLVAALERHVAAARARHGLEVSADLGTEPAIALAKKEALYRISQEALQNVARHAQAKRVAVRLESDAEAVTLSIADDGLGFDPTADYPGHLGLRSMRERAQAAGGDLVFRSRPGEGATITAALPVGKT